MKKIAYKLITNKYYTDNKLYLPISGVKNIIVAQALMDKLGPPTKNDDYWIFKDDNLKCYIGLFKIKGEDIYSVSMSYSEFRVKHKTWKRKPQGHRRTITFALSLFEMWLEYEKNNL